MWGFNIALPTGATESPTSATTPAEADAEPPSDAAPAEEAPAPTSPVVESGLFERPTLGPSLRERREKAEAARLNASKMKARAAAQAAAAKAAEQKQQSQAETAEPASPSAQPSPRAVKRATPRRPSSPGQNSGRSTASSTFSTGRAPILAASCPLDLALMVKDQARKRSPRTPRLSPRTGTPRTNALVPSLDEPSIVELRHANPGMNIGFYAAAGAPDNDRNRGSVELLTASAFAESLRHYPPTHKMQDISSSPRGPDHPTGSLTSRASTTSRAMPCTHEEPYAPWSGNTHTLRQALNAEEDFGSWVHMEASLRRRLGLMSGDADWHASQLHPAWAPERNKSLLGNAARYKERAHRSLLGREMAEELALESARTSTSTATTPTGRMISPFAKSSFLSSSSRSSLHEALPGRLDHPSVQLDGLANRRRIPYDGVTTDAYNAYAAVAPPDDDEVSILWTPEQSSVSALHFSTDPSRREEGEPLKSGALTPRVLQILQQSAELTTPKSTPRGNAPAAGDAEEASDVPQLTSPRNEHALSKLSLERLLAERKGRSIVAEVAALAPAPAVELTWTGKPKTVFGRYGGRQLGNVE